MTRCSFTHKLRHRDRTRRSNPFSHYYLLHCQRENSDIQPDRLVLHIPDVQCKFFIPSKRIPSLYLSPSSDTWKSFMPTCLEFVITREIGSNQWTRPHQAHFAPQNIPQLRQFIDTDSTQPLAK